MLATLSRLLVALCLLAAGSANASDGWTPDDIVATASNLLSAEVTLEEVAGLPPNLFLLDPTEESACFVRTGESIRSFAAGEFAHVAIIGDANRAHTVWVYFPILGVRDSDAAFAFFKGFFGSLLPGWAPAGTWAEKSLGEAWERAGSAFNDPMISYNDTIPRASVDGVLLATMGIPPDLVTYRLTTRTECEKVSDYLLAKPRRARCDPDNPLPELGERQILLHHARPRPIDRSETPFFLGRITASALRTEKLEFDLPGGLGSVGNLDWSEWIPGQVQGELTVDQIVSEDWLCAPYFINLVSMPDISPGPGSSWLFSVESVSAYASRTNGDISYDPSDVSALVFAKTAPTIPPRPPSFGVSYRMVPEGGVVFETEGDAMPVDVGGVPLQLGAIQIWRGGCQPAEHLPMDCKIEGLSVVLTSPATGASTTSDLGAWLDSQTGIAPAPDRARPISDPSLDFELDGRRFKIVLAGVDFEAKDGKATGARRLDGYLFAAP